MEYTFSESSKTVLIPMEQLELARAEKKKEDLKFLHNSYFEVYRGQLYAKQIFVGKRYQIFNYNTSPRTVLTEAAARSIKNVYNITNVVMIFGEKLENQSLTEHVEKILQNTF